MMRALACALVLAGVVEAQDTVRSTLPESTARRIALDRVHGAVRAESLDKRMPHAVYVYDITATGRPTDVTVRIDATDGHLIDETPVTHHLDSAALNDIRKESTVKDTAAMPPNTLKDTTAGRTHDSTSKPNPPH
jgi:hypothetical protein